MNPSTADADHDDRTVAWEIRYTLKSLGLHHYAKANVLDYRATYPTDLAKAPIPVLSDINHPLILRLASRASHVVMACGVLPRPFQHFASTLIASLEKHEIPLHCLRLTKDGWPQHPLYIPSDTPLIAFSGRE